MRRHPLQHRRRSLLRSQPVRHLHQLRRRHQRILRIAAQHADRCHRIALLESGDAGAKLFNRSRGLAARNQRQRRLVRAFAEINFDEVYADGFNANQHLPRSRLRNGQLGQLQNLRPARF